MRTYQEVWYAARDESPFSNGTEGECWTENWCDRCLVDAPYRNGLKGAIGCPLLAVALVGRTPSEWLDDKPFSLGEQYICVEFRAPGGGGGEPRPQPKPRDQLELFSRDGHESRRTLAPLSDDKPVTVSALVTRGEV